jgi:hypothetical protein
MGADTRSGTIAHLVGQITTDEVMGGVRVEEGDNLLVAHVEVKLLVYYVRMPKMVCREIMGVSVYIVVGSLSTSASTTKSVTIR